MLIIFVISTISKFKSSKKKVSAKVMLSVNKAIASRGSKSTNNKI